MNEQEAFKVLVSVVDFAIKNLNTYGINEVKSINNAIEVLSVKQHTTETYQTTIDTKNKVIERLEQKLKEYEKSIT